MKHLLNDDQPVTDLSYEHWLDIEGVVHRWLLESILPTISREFLFLNSAREVWESAKESYSKKNNLATIYDIMQRSTNLVQGNCLVLAYNNKLTSQGN